MNTFDRVQLNALVGAWPVTQVNLTTGSIDWWHTPSSGTSLTTSAFRKSGGGSVITPSVVGSDSGSNNSDGATPPFTWSDAVSGSPINANHISNTQTVGNGFRITCPVPRWPDWRLLRVYLLSGNPHQVTYTASMNDSTAVTQVEGIGGTPDLGGFNDAYKNLGSLVIEVKFASEVDSKTLTLDMLRNNSSMGYYGITAAALYPAAINKFPPKGSLRALEASGVFGPLGAR